ncbi:hypothetical protein APSETT445_003433 [Aspergillus pseudonomiae]
MSHDTVQPLSTLQHLPPTMQSNRHGDYVERHDVLAVIETEKVGMDVEAPESGVIRHLFVKEGDVVTIGQAIAEIAIQAKKG